MQKSPNYGDYRIEFKNFPNGHLEIRYFDIPRDSSYRSWKLPKEVVKELISWWKRLRKNKNIRFPIKEKTKICEFTMYTENYIEIREFDNLGRYKMIGFSLPKVLLKELVSWKNKESL
ncbi:MAG: hypothetical protein ACE5IT_07355 [bacterium]